MLPTICRLIFLGIFVFSMLAWGDEETPVAPLKTVASVDLSRYSGLWYEIAKIPNSFQRQCVHGTTAQYRLLEDGQIEVINSCTKKDGTLSQVKGVAKIVDKQSNAKLKVSFVNLLGLRLFWGDYWIIGLDENYQWAIVGTPSRKYGWILGRKPQLDAEQMANIERILQEQGYRPASLVRSMKRE